MDDGKQERQYYKIKATLQMFDKREYSEYT
jgi:hypothetical protein